MSGNTFGTSTTTVYGVAFPKWPDDYPGFAWIPREPWQPVAPVPYVPPPVPSQTLDLETSRELIEALVRQAVREHEDRIRDLEKRLAAAEVRIAKLEAKR